MTDQTIDTADTDVLREQISYLKTRNDSLTSTCTIQSANINLLASLVDYIGEDRVEEVREWADGDKERIDLVHSLTSINLRTDWEVTVTIPVTVTVLIEADDEDDARENINDYLYNNINITVDGSDEYDYDTSDCEINNIERG